MNTSIHRLGALAAIVLSAFGGSAHAQVNVTTYHNDNARTGQFTQETVLTPANVNSSQFGKLFTAAVDGWVYAQPLYLSSLSIGGSTHNVLYVATDHDTLYAIDADNGTIYWQFSLIPTSGATVNSITDLDCTDLVPEVGITGTPVIDANTGTIYLVAKSKIGDNFYHYLHAIDVSTATEKFGGPVNIQATVQGTATDGTGTTVSFNPLGENQRAALLLENGHVVIGWSSHCDHSP
jgi:outer membrane protein assembly factor BamB